MSLWSFIVLMNINKLKGEEQIKEGMVEMYSTEEITVKQEEIAQKLESF